MGLPTARSGSRLRGALRFFGVLAILGVLAVCGRFFWAFRDRFPGYRIEIAMPASAPAAGAGLRVGFGRVDITPSLAGGEARPVWLAGFSQGRRATNVHDPLVAVSVVWDDGRRRVGIVSLDAIGFFHDDVIRVRQRVKAEWKLDYVAVCSTHNHSTPDLLGLWGPSFYRSGVDPEYKERVIQAAADSVGQAVAGLRLARMSAHEVAVDPAGLVADTRKPEVYDADLRWLWFSDVETGRVLGSLVGWGNHPETPWSGNQDLTADFPGVLRDALERGVIDGGQVRQAGVGGVHVFVNGAVGGLMTTHPSTTVRDPYLGEDFKKPSHEKTRAVGRQLAKRILDRMAQPTNALSGVTSASLGIFARTLELPLENRGFVLAGFLGLLDRGHSSWMHMRSEVAFLTLGEASVACIPGEIYPEIVNGGIVRAPGGDFDIEPLEIPPLRALMPGRVKFLFGLANDEIGYIIPKSEWDHHPPHLFNAQHAPYGEVNSLGPETAYLLHQAVSQLIDAARGNQP